LWLVLLGLSTLACKKPAPPAPETIRTDAAAGSNTSAPASHSLPFIEDDYPRALAAARANKQLLFVDVWAPWCHTCLSLKRFVLTDPALTQHAAAFAWAAVDSEKPENAALIEKLGLSVLPTLWVIDPETEKPVWTWKGALTASELSGALHDVRAKREGARGAQADALAASLESEQKWDECVDVAQREGPSLAEGTYRVDLAVTGARCAMDAPDKSNARAALPKLVAELDNLTASSSAAVLADDRSSAFEARVAAHKAQGDAALAKTTATRWAAFLEAAANAAKSPQERAVFDSHRLGAYLELGQPERALPMLAQSERDFPDDYNASARKARALLELGRLDDALASADRALAKAYGGRRLRIFLLKADVYAKKKEASGERAVLDAALAEAKTIPLRASYERLRKSIEERRAALAPAK
jgi:thiol-disulfide isomerase/thioredoxin